MTFQDGYHLGVQDCEYALKCSHQNQHTEGAGIRWCTDCGKKEPEDEEEAGYIAAPRDFGEKYAGVQ